MSEILNCGKVLIALQLGQTISGTDGVLASFINKLIETALQGVIDPRIVDSIVPRWSNDKICNTIKSTYREFELETLRGRAGTFEVRIVNINKTIVSDKIEKKDVLNVAVWYEQSRHRITRGSCLLHQGLYCHNRQQD